MIWLEIEFKIQLETKSNLQKERNTLEGIKRELKGKMEIISKYKRWSDNYRDTCILLLLIKQWLLLTSSNYVH